jgi:protein-tyrosine phosphatase
MAGYIDLHLHVVPGVDDGVTRFEDAALVCRGLKSLGYERLVTTPHIRTGMFENRRAGLEAAFARLTQELADDATLPELGLSAEHHCDALFFELFQQGEILPFPGTKAVLVEFPYDALPVNVEQICYKLRLKGLRPAIAHPERCTPLFKRTEPIARLIDQEVALQLDLMSLVGKYGRAVKKTAERLIDEGVYTIAATDSHSPEDIRRVGDSINALFKLVGDDEANILLGENPALLLRGEQTL